MFLRSQSEVSLVDGPEASQMEEDRREHEEANRLKPFLTLSPPPVCQEEPLARKIQNGAPKSPYAEVNGDTKWQLRGFLGAPLMKGAHVSPDLLPADGGHTLCLQNGGIKRTVSEPSLSGVHQTKKSRLDQRANGESASFRESQDRTPGNSSKHPPGSAFSETREPGSSAAQDRAADTLPALPTPNYRVSGTPKQPILPQQEGNGVVDRDEDLVSLPTKAVLMPNGAMAPATPVGSMPGALPDCVSNAVLRTPTQSLPSHEPSHPLHTSGQAPHLGLPPEPALAVPVVGAQNPTTRPSVGSLEKTEQLPAESSTLLSPPELVPGEDPAPGPGSNAQRDSKQNETNGASCQQDSVLPPNSIPATSEPPTAHPTPASEGMLEEPRHHPGQILPTLPAGNTKTQYQGPPPALHMPATAQGFPKRPPSNDSHRPSQAPGAVPTALYPEQTRLPVEHFQSQPLAHCQASARHARQEPLKDGDVEGGPEHGRPVQPYLRPGWIDLTAPRSHPTEAQPQWTGAVLRQGLQYPGSASRLGGFQEGKAQGGLMKAGPGFSPGPRAPQHHLAHRTPTHMYFPRADPSPQVHAQSPCTPRFRFQQRPDPPSEKPPALAAPQTSEAEPVSHSHLSQHKPPHMQATQPTPSQNSLSQNQQQQQKSLRQNSEQMPVTFLYPPDHADQQKLLGQMKVEACFPGEVSYSKSSDCKATHPQTGLEQAQTAINRNLPSGHMKSNVCLEPVSCSNRVHPFPEEKGQSINAEVFKGNKFPNLHHAQYFPNNVTPQTDVLQRCFQEREQKLPSSAMLQGCQSRNLDASAQQPTTHVPPRYVPQNQAFPGPQPSEGHPHPQPHKDLQRHAALRWHLLQKQEQQLAQQCHPEPGQPQMSRSIKVEPGTMPQACMCPTSAPPEKMWKKPAKQEVCPTSCERGQQRSILATMEQRLKQFQTQAPFDPKTLAMKSQKPVKVEPAVSSSAQFVAEHQPERTPTTKRAAGSVLNSFLESPYKLIDAPVKNFLDATLKTQYDFPPCRCVGKSQNHPRHVVFTQVSTFCLWTWALSFILFFGA